MSSWKRCTSITVFILRLRLCFNCIIILSLPKRILDNILPRQECKELIRCSKEKGYEQALVNIGGGKQKLIPSFRDCQRCLIDSTELVGAFWERLAEFIPQTLNQYKVLGLNERLRFLRYDPGEFFKPHFDGPYERGAVEHSKITVQIYLNEGFEGGSTTFLPYLSTCSDPTVECVPKIAYEYECPLMSYLLLSREMTPNSLHDSADGEEDDHFLRIIKRSYQEPVKKFEFPQTEAQEVGWYYTPLAFPWNQLAMEKWFNGSADGCKETFALYVR